VFVPGADIEIYSSVAVAPDGAPGAGAVYVGADDHQLYALPHTPASGCLDPATRKLSHADGCVLWKEATNDKIRSAPVVHPDNGRIFVTTEGPGRLYGFLPEARCENDPTIACEESSDCGGAACSHRHWDLPVTSHMHFNPVLDPADGTIFVGGENGLYAVGPKPVGSEPSVCSPDPAPCIKWRFQDEGVRAQAFLAGGVLDGGARVLYAAGVRSLVAIDVDPAGAEPFELLWEYDTGGTRERQSPALSDDKTMIFLSVRDSGAVHAIPTSTCEPSPWRFDVKLNLPFSTALAGGPSNNWVFWGGEDKCVYGLDPTTTDDLARRRWDFRAKGAFQSAPALSADGRTLYIGNQSDYFFALDAEAECEQCSWADNRDRIRWCYYTGNNLKLGFARRNCSRELKKPQGVNPKPNGCCDPSDAKRCPMPPADTCLLS